MQSSLQATSQLPQPPQRVRPQLAARQVANSVQPLLRSLQLHQLLPAAPGISRPHSQPRPRPHPQPSAPGPPSLCHAPCVLTHLCSFPAASQLAGLSAQQPVHSALLCSTLVLVAVAYKGMVRMLMGVQRGATRMQMWPGPP